MFIVRKACGGARGFYVGRPTVLGNPYAITPQRSRDDVCNMYESWFAVSKTLPEVKAVLDDLLRIHRELQPKRMVLLCHCAPERCHADTIAAYLNAQLEKDRLV